LIDALGNQFAEFLERTLFAVRIDITGNPVGS
jgi:hypothetical protein